MLSTFLGFVLVVFGLISSGVPVDPPPPIPPIVYEMPSPTPTVDQSKTVFTKQEALELMKLAGIPPELHEYFWTLGTCESGWNRLNKGDLYSDGYYRSLGILQTNVYHYFPASMSISEIHYLLNEGLVSADQDPYNPVTNLRTGYNLYLRLGTFGTTGGWYNCALKHNLP